MTKLLFIFCLLLIEIPLFGQCDNSIQPTRNEKVGYKSRGNRCEGEYSQKVGAQSLQIVGLTVGRFSYKLEKTESIIIQNTTGVSFNIRSSAIPIDTYYRMDAFLKNGQNLEWNIGDVVYPLNLPSSSLGVYGWIGPDERDRTYIPIKPVSSNYDKTKSNIHLLVRPNSKVLRVEYRYSQVDQNPSKYEIINGSFRSGQPIEIILPSKLNGTYLVEIRALLESKDDWVNAKYKISIQ